VLRACERAVALLCLAAVGASALVLMTIFGLIAYSVAMRYVFGLPQPWIDEAVGWLLAACVMLAVPEVQRRGEHIGIDFMASKLRGRGYRALALFAVAAVLASAAIYVREGVEMVTFSRMLNVLSNQIPEVPLWMVQGVVPVGFGLMVLVALVQFACLLAGLAPGAMSRQTIEDV
jgi:TRAP-type C4-dicarboxylate transport system permease small subunit